MAAKKKATTHAPSDGSAQNQQDNDGSPFVIQEQKSVAKLTRATKKGQQPPPDPDAVRKWKQKVIQRLRDTGHTPEASYLQKNWGDDNNISNDDAFAKVWGERAGLTTGKYKYSYLWNSTHHATSGSLGGALQGNDAKGNKLKDRESLMNDPTYQEVTSVSRVRPDGNVGGPGADDNYAVWPRPGHLIKVVYGNPPSTHYMPSDDTNPAGKTSGELSYHAATTYGSRNTKSDAGSLGPSPGYLSNDQWDFIGQNNLRNADGKTIPNNQQDFEAACKRRKLTFTPPKTTADAGAGPKLMNGYATVSHGADDKGIGYADVASNHAAGGHMIQGSATVFVGPEQYPVSRVGDGTSDGMEAITGADDFYVG